MLSQVTWTCMSIVWALTLRLRFSKKYVVNYKCINKCYNNFLFLELGKILSISWDSFTLWWKLPLLGFISTKLSLCLLWFTQYPNSFRFGLKKVFPFYFRTFKFFLLLSNISSRIVLCLIWAPVLHEQISTVRAIPKTFPPPRPS